MCCERMRYAEEETPELELYPDKRKIDIIEYYCTDK